ncbi:hypothetical protein G6F35_016372 [Rhizopus arrhizus]|nr:hypothetical protein G6F35_016372 [Rhizopus arrhizus]
MPSNAGITASTLRPSCWIPNAPCSTRPVVSEIVDTVNASPSACTSSSRCNPSDCRYGTAGITNTPVAPVTTPESAPTSGPSQRSRRCGTRNTGASNA